MRACFALMLALTGCGRFLGLDPPQLADADGSESHDDASSDGARSDVGTDSIAGSTSCPGNYVTGPNQPTKYRFSAIKATWPVAAADCADDTAPGGTIHTHLVVLADDFESSTVNISVAGSPGYSMWIGLSDRVTTSLFRWVTDEATNFPMNQTWATGEPSTGADDDCVLMTNVQQFDATNCNQLQAYVCECDAYPNDPANY